MKTGIFIWIVLRVTQEWILKEEAQAEEASTEEVCVRNSTEEWNLTEGKNPKEEKSSTEDKILTQDFHFGGYYFFNKCKMELPTINI